MGGVSDVTVTLLSKRLARCPHHHRRVTSQKRAPCKQIKLRPLLSITQVLEIWRQIWLASQTFVRLWSLKCPVWNARRQAGFLSLVAQEGVRSVSHQKQMFLTIISHAQTATLPHIITIKCFKWRRNLKILSGLGTMPLPDIIEAKHQKKHERLHNDDRLSAWSSSSLVLGTPERFFVRNLPSQKWVLWGKNIFPFLLISAHGRIPCNWVSKFWQGKVARNKAILLQHVKLNHCSYIALL